MKTVEMLDNLLRQIYGPTADVAQIRRDLSTCTTARLACGAGIVTPDMRHLVYTLNRMQEGAEK